MTAALSEAGSWSLSALPVMLAGVPDSAYAEVLASLLEKQEGAILHVARDEGRMEALADALHCFAPNAEVLTFPAWDCLPYDRVSPNPVVVSERVEALSRLVGRQETGNVIVLTTVSAILQRVPPQELLAGTSFTARVGDEINRDQLAAFLHDNGYTRVGKAMEPGEFAFRGSIIDIFPSGSEEGLRLDLFGETLETLRAFDPLTQISGERRELLSLLPVSEIVLTEEAIERFRDAYRLQFGAVTREDPLYEAVSAGRKYPGMEHWLPLFYEDVQTLFDYVPSATVTLDHLAAEAMRERDEMIRDYYATRQAAEKAVSKHRDGAVYHPLPPETLYLPEGEWQQRLANGERFLFSPFIPDSTGAGEGMIREYGYKPAPRLTDRVRENSGAATGERANVIELFKDECSLQRQQKRKSVVACMTSGSRERLQTVLMDHSLHVVLLDGWADVKSVSGKSVGLIVLPLDQGYLGEKVALFSEQDLFGEKIIRRSRARKKSAAFMAEAASLQAGELVVHKEHGIGRFEGLEAVTVTGAPHDCLKLIYEGGDKLFLPVENSDVITRYGGEYSEARLDKLGGVSWQARKAKLKEKIRLAAEELLHIAAGRALAKAPNLVSPHGLYDEFCARFPYAETDDQLRAIEDIREDLTKGQPMDRLICGDVGFGKTEVALRAAFIAASGEGRKQVAVITPTTLLCRQHYQTFRDRFAGTGIEVRQLSRLVSSKEATDVRAGLADGRINIVIGTHALLGKLVKFHNLSLLIIDEEQHFGVAQKEKLKKLRNEVHVLTLSATPIPRTLQLSLAGVKELSLIATPPVDRLAVRTFVSPFDAVVIREAILREHYRGGQVFYVCPRIEDLTKLQKQLTELVPEIRIAVAHGQMPAQQLDELMNEFYDGKYDLLLSTTIIESGLDVPSANTMIIHRADMFGLSQLYQLRGRVGRGKIRAYCYLTLPTDRMLSTTALKRLEVMQALDTLGAGFSLASHDMDIRGYGNLLGEEQSGHVKEVGVELYQQMLEEAVAAARARAEMPDDGGQSEERWSPQINLGIAVLIPESYVEDLSLRMGLYRRLSSLDTVEELDSFAAEMSDRFGVLPEEVRNLLEVMQVKQLCRQAGVEKIDAGPKGVVVTFHDNRFHHPAALIDYIGRHSKDVKLRADHKLVVSRPSDTAEARLKSARKVLNELITLGEGGN